MFDRVDEEGRVRLDLYGSAKSFDLITTPELTGLVVTLYDDSGKSARAVIEDPEDRDELVARLF
jgi:hypothetical protein